jgi:hypothetical protein
MSDGDREIEAAVRDSLVRQARSAPGPAGLLAAVRARRRRRRTRDLLTGGIATVAVVAGAFAGVQALRSGHDRPAAAEVPAPGVFATGELDLCLLRDGTRLSEVVFTVRTGGDLVETETIEPSGDQRFHVHVERAGTYTLRLDVLSGSPPLTGSRDLAGGRVGTDPDSGDRVLYLPTGIGDSTLRLAVRGSGPNDAQLLGWARQITVAADGSAC